MTFSGYNMRSTSYGRASTSASSSITLVRTTTGAVERPEWVGRLETRFPEVREWNFEEIRKSGCGDPFGYGLTVDFLQEVGKRDPELRRAMFVEKYSCSNLINLINRKDIGWSDRSLHGVMSILYLSMLWLVWVRLDSLLTSQWCRAEALPFSGVHHHAWRELRALRLRDTS